MKTCKACGKNYNTGKIVFLMTEDGLKGARVCQSCANGGATIVAVKVATKPKERLAPEEKDVRGILRGLARELQAKAKMYQGGPFQVGLDMATGIVDAWAKNEAVRRSD